MEAGGYEAGTKGLVGAVQDLSRARDLPAVQDIIRRAARTLTGADGATFILRDGPMCLYADEDAIAPLWKGRRFPLESCISGWSMLHRQAVLIEDIYADDRIPHDAYRPTFVKSLVMVPIRSTDPLGAIGNYWATRHRATSEEKGLLQALADSTAVAMEHIATLHTLERRVSERTAELAARTTEAESLAIRLSAEIETRRRAEETVRRLSLTDELTGLANRRGFLVRAEQAQAITRRPGVTSTVLFADVDGLKHVNDCFGHGAGDDVIRAAAAVLAADRRQEDIVARWGGDEFVAFLPGVADVDEVRKRLADQLAAMNQNRPGPPIALSVGAVTIGAGDLRSLPAVIEEADRVMYADKQRRRQTSLVG
jgi:diguanylate cyclase (GGDEF)-like protein